MQTILLVLVLSLDAFVASMAYGTNGIKVPFKSIIIIDLVCSFSLFISLILGTFLGNIFPNNITTIISFLILLSIGIYYLFESMVKSYLKKRKEGENKLKLKLFNISLIIEIYIDEMKADIDNSKTLSSGEALYLAFALSLDSLAIGFGTGLVNINIFYIIIFSLIMNLVAIWLGLLLGKIFVEKSKVDLSWFTGIILIILAIFRLV